MLLLKLLLRVPPSAGRGLSLNGCPVVCKACLVAPRQRGGMEPRFKIQTKKTRASTDSKATGASRIEIMNPRVCLAA